VSTKSTAPPMTRGLEEITHKTRSSRNYTGNARFRLFIINLLPHKNNKSRFCFTQISSPNLDAYDQRQN